MTERTRCFVAASVLAAGGLLRAQDANTLLNNTDQLQVNVALDRTAYFPGEAAAVTFLVRNPGAGPLAVLAPFAAATGCLSVYKLSGEQVPSLLAGERLCGQLSIDSSTPRTVLAAFQQQYKTLNSYDPLFDLGPDGLEVIPGGIPADPGYYSLEYSYGTAGEVAFQVVVPHLDASAVARVPDIPYFDPVLGQTVATEAYMHAFALRWINQTSICVTQEPGSIDTAVTADAQGNFDGQMGAYLRVASSQNPVTSMALASDSSGNLTVKWTDSSNGQHTLAVGTAPIPAAPGSVQIGLDPVWVHMPAADTEQFTASVFGPAPCVTCTVNQSVNWSVALGSDAPAGSATGTISASGLYSAPSTIKGSYTLIVTAQTQLAPAKSAIAIVVLGPTVP